MGGYRRLMDYQRIREEELPQAERLATYLVARYIPRGVVDFGCADGLYLEPFYRRGIHVLGVDVSLEALQLGTVPNLMWADLRKDLYVGLYELVLCLETMEHIPEPGSAQAVANVARACGGRVIFSAAHPGQGGSGHVNLQHKDYWRELFGKQGLKESKPETDDLVAWMRAGYRMGWFEQNVMVMGAK